MELRLRHRRAGFAASLMALALLGVGWSGAAEAGQPSHGVVSISAGLFYTCAVRSGGTVWCWGRNYQGSLGDGTLKNRSHPVQVLNSHGDPLTKAIAVSVGADDHACVVRSLGDIWCWGYAWYGQLGNGVSGTTFRKRAVQVTGDGQVPFTNAKAAPRETSTPAHCAGTARSGAGGMTRTAKSVTAAHRPTGPWIPFRPRCASGVADSSRTRRRSMQVVRSLGLRTSPVGVQSTRWGVPDARQMAIGGYHACVLMGNGSVWCWGLDDHGQLGDGGHGTHAVRRHPVRVVFQWARSGRTRPRMRPESAGARPRRRAKP
jgi:Regulator of chromosome condensation (RCC1) repeat